MGIRDTLARRWGYIKAGKETPVTDAFFKAQANAEQSPRTTEAMTNLIANSSFVYTAVSLAANFCAKVHVDVWQGEDIIESEFDALYHRTPNPYQSGYQFRLDLYSWWFLRRKATVYLNRASENAPIDEMFCLNPSDVKPAWNEDKTQLVGYVYNSGAGRPLPLETWQIMYITGWSHRGLFEDLSPLEPLYSSILADVFEVEWTQRFYGKDNAKVPGAFAFKQMVNDQDWYKLKQEAKEQWGGLNRSGPMFLRGVGDGVSWLQMGLNAKDMQALEQRRFSKEEIYEAIAPGILSMLSDSSSLASANAGRASFVDMTADPALTMVDENLSKSILPAYGTDLEAWHEDISVVDRVVEDQQINTAAQFKTLDEVREEYYGLDPIGDERGNLLVAQVTSNAPAAPEQPPAQTQPAPDMTPADTMPDQKQARQVDLEKWRKKAIKRLVRHDSAVCDFESDYITDADNGAIKAALLTCNGPEDVHNVFDQFVRADGAIVREVKSDPRIGELLTAIKSAQAALEAQPQQWIINNHIPPANVTVQPEFKMDAAPVAVNVPAPIVEVNVQPAPVTVQNAGDVVVQPRRPM